MEKNIISCREYTPVSEFDRDPVLGEPPVAVRNYDVTQLKGRLIKNWSCRFGSYGTGGPGFFGLRLSGNDFDEWFVLTLWSAGEWLLLDKQWVEANPKYYQQQKPLYSNFSGQQQWDTVTDRVVGSTIIDIVIEDECSAIVLHNDTSGTHYLEIPQDTALLSPQGNGKTRIWNTQESQKDAWVITGQSLWVDDEK